MTDNDRETLRLFLARVEELLDTIDEYDRDDLLELDGDPHPPSALNAVADALRERLESHDVQQLLATRQPPEGTVRARFPLAINERSQWCVYGWTDCDPQDAKERALDGIPGGGESVVRWIEVDVLPAVPQAIQAEVVQ